MSTDFTVECGSGPFVVRFWAVVLFLSLLYVTSLKGQT